MFATLSYNMERIVSGALLQYCWRVTWGHQVARIFPTKLFHLVPQIMDIGGYFDKGKFVVNLAG